MKCKNLRIILTALFIIHPQLVLANELDDALNSNLIISISGNLGTGVVIENHKILTAAHVIGENKKVTLVLRENMSNTQSKTYKITGDVVHVDKNKDLALIATTTELLPIKRSNENYGIGSTVYAIGAPNEYIQVTKGVISAILQDGEVRYIQTDAAINPGNSGGALISEKGELIGLVVSRSKSQEGIGFAVDINSINNWLETFANENITQDEVKETSNQPENSELNFFLNESFYNNSLFKYFIGALIVLILIIIYNLLNRAKRKHKSRHFKITFND